jgi:hypothetical protein
MPRVGWCGRALLVLALAGCGGKGAADDGGGGEAGTTSGRGGATAGSGGNAGTTGGTGGRGGATGAAGSGGTGGQSGVSYSACTVIGGINRTVVAKRDAQRNLCVVFVLGAPGNPFNLTLPANTGMESAFAMPAIPDCRIRFPPTGAVEASGGTGSMALPPTPQPTVQIDMTLTFPANDAGAAASERLMASGFIAPAGCP